MAWTFNPFTGTFDKTGAQTTSVDDLTTWALVTVKDFIIRDDYYFVSNKVELLLNRDFDVLVEQF